MATLWYVGILLPIILILPIVFLWILWSNRNSLVTNWPVFGMFPTLVCNVSRVHDFATDILYEAGGTFLFKGPWFGGMDFMVTSDPINLNYLLSKNFGNYKKGNEFKEIFEPLGDGILAADSESWRIQRKLLHSLFSDHRFKATVERLIQQKISNGLFPVLDNASRLGHEVDLQDIFQRLTFDNISMLIFGFEPNCLSVQFPQVPIEKAFHDMEEAVIFRHVVPSRIWKLQRFLHIGKERSLSEAWKILHHFVVQQITANRDRLTRTENRLKSQDFNVLTYFLSLEDELENGVHDIRSNKFLIDMAFNLMGAGRDTIAAALVWIFWFVGTNPFVEKRIIEEMKANLHRDEDDHKLKIFSFEELNKLIYLHAVICEVLRLYPTLPFDHIVSIDEDTLPSGHHILKNFKILYSIYSMGRMEEIWGNDCLEFKPERWISKQGEIIHVPTYKFIAFNTGPRSCLGKNLTFIQLKAISSAVLWNYCVQVVKNHPAEPSTSMILYMRNGLKTRVSKRFVS